MENYIIIAGAIGLGFLLLYGCVHLKRYCLIANANANANTNNNIINDNENDNNRPHILIIHQDPIPPPYKEVDDDHSLPPAYEV